MGFGSPTAKFATIGALSAALLNPGTAEAYIDPGSASYMFQALAGTILGGLFLIRTYWSRLKATLLGRSVDDHRQH